MKQFDALLRRLPSPAAPAARKPLPTCSFCRHAGLVSVGSPTFARCPKCRRAVLLEGNKTKWPAA
jgi:hypothetical protein